MKLWKSEAVDLAEELLSSVEALAYFVHKPVDEATARHVMVLVADAARDIDALAHEVMPAAQGAGVTWLEIGQAFGITRQSAHERYRPNGVRS